LRALARSLPEAITELDAEGSADGATGVAGDVVVHLAEGPHPDRALGRALAVARRHGARTVHVLAEPGTRAVGTVARRAEAFADPPHVWEVRGAELTRAAATPAAPVLVVDPYETFPEAVALLVAGGAEALVEDGVLVGEVMGLEVARWVDEDPGRLEVGVGRHDREAFELLHGHLPPAAALAQVIDTVRAHRQPGAEHHPLNRLALERWLRRSVMARPEAIGVRHLAPADPPVPRTGVKDPRPAVAVGVDLDDRSVVVVTSTGIDIDLVPFAADARLRHDPRARLVVVVPERDAHAVTRDLAVALRVPAEVSTVPEGWREWAHSGAPVP